MRWHTPANTHARRAPGRSGRWVRLGNQDQQSGAPHRIQSRPAARSAHSATLLWDDQMMIFGGFGGRSDTDFLADLWSFNLIT